MGNFRFCAKKDRTIWKLPRGGGAIAHNSGSLSIITLRVPQQVLDTVRMSRQRFCMRGQTSTTTRAVKRNYLRFFYLPKFFSELIRNYLCLLYLPKFLSELIR